MEVTKAKVANALTSAAKDHVIAVAGDVFDEELQKYQSEINKTISAGSGSSDCVLDLGVVASDEVAFEKAGEPEVVNDPRIRVIHWRTADRSDDGGRGDGGTIFQGRYHNWYVVQWTMFVGQQRLCQARCITTGGKHTVGDWQELVLPATMSYDAATRQLKATGVQPSVEGPAAKESTLLTLPTATKLQDGLMAAADYAKLSALPTNQALTQSLSAKVNAVAGKGLSTYDFDLEHLLRLSHAGLYGRKSGLKYGVNNLFSLAVTPSPSIASDEELRKADAAIRTALTSASGVRLLETDLTYCAENGCCLFDETTNGYVIVNKAADGTMYNLIEISVPRFGAPGVTTFELPSIRVVTLVSKADASLPPSEWTPENAIWSCRRVMQEKFAYKNDVIAMGTKLFIDTWNSFSKLNDARYDPANAPDADHPFYANEVWLTYPEAIAVYEYGKTNFTQPQQLAVQSQANAHCQIRTNLLMPMCSDGLRAANTAKTAYGNYSLETIRVSSNLEIDNSSAYNGLTPYESLMDFCRGCAKLRKVLGVVYLDRLQTSYKNNYSDIFKGCPALEDFTFIRLKTDLGFPGAPKVSLKSMQTLVNYAINTTAVTVAVHPDVYAKLTGDTSNPAAAALSATERTQWSALLSTATNRNIQFINTPL